MTRKKVATGNTFISHISEREREGGEKKAKLQQQSSQKKKKRVICVDDKPKKAPHARRATL